MKLSNMFKKSTKTSAKANIEKLEKTQLEKVIGGADVQLSTSSKSLIGHEAAHTIQQ